MDIQVLHTRPVNDAKQRVHALAPKLRKLGVKVSWGPDGLTGTLTGNVKGNVWIRERDVYLRGSLGFAARALGEARIKQGVEQALHTALNG